VNAKQKVLIVDDEPRNQRIIAETLQDLFELQNASSGEEALECLKNNPADLVLLDIMMPGLNGYEVCAKIRADPALQYTKVILVSGKAMVDERLKGYEMGANDYMTKPFIAEELLAKAKVFLQLTKIESELSEMNKSLDLKVQEKAQLLIEAEMKLMNSAKMSALGEMAGGVAHEINTPLATILLIADQQMERPPEDLMDFESTQGAFKTVAKAAQHISKIVQGLRFFSRDSSVDPFINTDVAKVVDDTVLLCAERFKTHGLRLEVEKTSVFVSCRPVQIAQVLLNLLNNSFHAVQTQSDKWIRVSVKDNNGSVEISVTDSGSGIAPEVRSKIFQPFFTTKDVGEGTGLGLSISKGIVESHKGTLTLEEKSPHTCFLLRIPKTQQRIQNAG
jgi:C4-dicarboxylate-specific signal transduction histidine kinase